MTSRPPVVEVIWEDSAHGTLRWESRADAIAAHQLTRVRSAGYLVSETSDGLLICLSFDGGVDDVAACISIPRSAIRRRRTLAP